MYEILDQILTEVRSAMRFRWYGLALTWIVCLAGWTWAATQPNVYEASARVYVDTSSVLEPVLGNQIVAANVDAQLAYVREMLLGRAQLETVAMQVGLEATAQTAAQRERILENLRQAVQLTSAGGRTRNAPDSIYTITYRSSNREQAIGVVDTLLDNFIETTHGANRQEGDTAERFLDERVDEYEARLAQAEQALADFKKANADKLPGTEGDYFQRMQTERDQLADAYRQMRVLESKRKQLVESLQSKDPVVKGLVDTETEPPPNSIDARIRDLEARLDSLLLQYTEKHPDVIAAREQLARLMDQRAEQLAALGVDDTNQELQGLTTNPAYQMIQVAIAETDVDMAQLRADIAEREDRVANLQSLIDEVPEVEAELARLNRDYTVVYEQYLALVRSRETQTLTRKASETDQIDFRIINPPLASFSPVAPNRLLLLAAVFGAAVAAGAGLCYLLAQLRPVFSNRTGLRRQIGLPVFGVVMNAFRAQQRARRRLALAAYCGAHLVLLTAFVGLVGLELAGPGVYDVLGKLL